MVCRTVTSVIRRIAHLDMDAFFASVELLRRPDLRGQPVVVGGRSDGMRHAGTKAGPDARLRAYTGRGVVTTATYEARAFGVHSGMGLMKAAALAPDAVLLPANFDAYRQASIAFKAAVADITPAIEDRGIDEIYIDLTSLPDDSHTLARRIKQTVREATGLTCSIGITPNKLLSKIASELDKPDGITILHMRDVEARIWPLSVRRVNGIGPKAGVILAGLGVNTVGDLARAAPALLRAHFGAAYTAWLVDAAHGVDSRPVITESEPKSFSRETTFERDLHAVRDRAVLGNIFTHLCERLAADLHRKGYTARTIGVKLRFDDFRTVTRDLSMQVASQDAVTIRRVAGVCLKRVGMVRKLRLLGVRASALQKDGNADTLQQEFDFSS